MEKRDIENRDREKKESMAHLSVDSPAALPQIASRLMGTIAHDLRTPITVVRGYLKMMLSERLGLVTPEQKECLEGAMNSMNQLTSLAALIGEGSGFMEQIHPEFLNIQEDVFRKIWEAAQPQAMEKAIVLRENFPTEGLVACGDRQILSDVIQEIIVRSIGFANRRTELSAALSRRKSGDILLKIVFTRGPQEPDGHNVVSELHKQVFLHGGKLTFSTEPENRSSFTLLLPGIDA